MLIYTQIYAQNTITFGKTMYQNKAFTTGELLLWLYASNTSLNIKSIYSYKKINDLYRVRFYEDWYWKCFTLEHFVYYNDKGVEVKRSSVFTNVYSGTCKGSKVTR